MRLADEKIELFSQKQAVKYAQKIVREYIPKDKSLVDELLEEKRVERQAAATKWSYRSGKQAENFFPTMEAFTVQ